MTKERKIKTKTKKVDQFLNKWESKQQDKTITRNKIPKKKDEIINKDQTSIESNT